MFLRWAKVELRGKHFRLRGGLSDQVTQWIAPMRKPGPQGILSLASSLIMNHSDTELGHRVYALNVTLGSSGNVGSPVTGA